MTNNRHLAVEILEKIIKEKLFFEKTSDSFINMLVLTALRHLSTTEHLLRQIAPKKSKAHFFLICAITELLYMDSASYAVVNTYVKQIKKKFGSAVGGFANAVLRKFCNLPKPTEVFPQNFAKILSSSYDSQTIKQIEPFIWQEPFLDITCKEDLTDFIDGTSYIKKHIRLPNNVCVENIYGFEQGLWFVQDIAASLAIRSLGNLEGKKALDLCAAPGGKTAQLLIAKAQTTAVDISESRLKTLKQNLSRLQLSAQKVICMDSLEFCKNCSEKFDIILLDAPCSATGTFRRHPELLHTKNMNDVLKQTQLQQQLLEAASKLLNKDGILIYCVCSIAKEEGEKQIEHFVKKHSKFKIYPLECPIKAALTKQGFIRTLPFMLEGGMDSFFVGALQFEQ